jgi:hypothetical protein
MEHREVKYEELCALVKHMPEIALGKEIGAILVIVPHHEYRKQFSDVIRDAFTDFGYAVDRSTTTVVCGEEFCVYIQSISTSAGRGYHFHAAYIPTDDGFNTQQKNDLKRLRESMIFLVGDEALTEY